MKHSLNKLIFGLVLVAASQANAMEETMEGFLSAATETILPKVAQEVTKVVVTEAVTGETGNSTVAYGWSLLKGIPGFAWGVTKATPGVVTNVAKATPGFVTNIPGVVANIATSSERVNSFTHAALSGATTILKDDPYYTREVLVGAAALTATAFGVRSAYRARTRAIEEGPANKPLKKTKKHQVRTTKATKTETTSKEDHLATLQKDLPKAPKKQKLAMKTEIAQLRTELGL